MKGPCMVNGTLQSENWLANHFWGPGLRVDMSLGVTNGDQSLGWTCMSVSVTHGDLWVSSQRKFSWTMNSPLTLWEEDFVVVWRERVDTLDLESRYPLILHAWLLHLANLAVWWFKYMGSTRDIKKMYNQAYITVHNCLLFEWETHTCTNTCKFCIMPLF